MSKRKEFDYYQLLKQSQDEKEDLERTLEQASQIMLSLWSHYRNDSGPAIPHLKQWLIEADILDEDGEVK